MKAKRFVRMFQPRFASLVKSGQKRQTIRPTPKREPHKGDTIDCREWTGKPYRSKQRKLIEAIVTNTRIVWIAHDGRLFLDNDQVFSAKDLDAFAKADGFKDWRELASWFDDTHGLPFVGLLILW